nr:hypothetical protein [Humibacter ginsenosidimutans]
MIWPAAAPMPSTAAYRPTALALDWPWKTDPIIAITLVVTKADAIPCTNRPMTSTSAFDAAAQSTEAATKTAMPITNALRRPNLSPIRAAVSRAAAVPSEKAAMNHSTALSLACSSACIEGSATLTMKKSMAVMNVPMSRALSARHGGRVAASSSAVVAAVVGSVTVS